MDNRPATQETSRGKRVALTVALYILWFVWVALVHPLKITAFVDPPQDREDIASYAMIGGIIKAMLIVGPYWCIRAIRKKL